MRVTEKWREQIEKGLMPESVHKTFVPESVEGSEVDGVRKAAFVVSTGAEDRDGDTVNPDGWVLDNYRKNPVVLWAHDVKSLPVAKAEKIAVEGGKLKSITVFPQKGVYPFADQVFGLVAGGFLKGTSVGFHPIEAAPRKGKTKGVDFNRQELYEFSILPIPSNREALVEAKSAGHDVSLVVKWASDFLDYAEQNGIWVPKFQIEKALRLVLPLQVAVPALPSAAATQPEGHASAGAALSDDEAKGLLDILAKDAEPEVLKYIRFNNGKWCVYSESGKKLGEHDTRAEAVNQLQAIEANKHRGSEPDVVKHGDHDQSTHGRGHGGGSEDAGPSERRRANAGHAMEGLKSSGGFSLDRAGNPPKGGFMVSPYKNREHVIEGDATEADLVKYQWENADALDQPGHFMGGWKDNGKTYLDVSRHVDTEDEAHALAQEHEQLAIYDVAGGKSIPTRKRKKEFDMDDMVTKIADELFGETKAAPPWQQEAPADESGKVNPDEAAKAAREAAKAQNDQAKADEKAAPEGAAPAEPGQTPGKDPTEADPALAGILDDLARGLLAEIQPLKQGGDPTSVATGLKAALEKFAAAFMQTYVVPGAQAGVPPAGTPAAPPAKPAAPQAPPPPAAPQGQAPQAAPAAAPQQQTTPPPPPLPKRKGIEIEGITLDEDELRDTIQKVVRRQMAEGRMRLTGRLPD